MVSQKKKRKYWAFEQDKPKNTPLPDPSPAKRAPGKKDTKHWCRGKVGVPHEPEVTLDHNYGLVCRPHRYYNWRLTSVPREQRFYWAWSCRHRITCKNCGKVLEYNIPVKTCPDYNTGQIIALAKEERVTNGRR